MLDSTELPEGTLALTELQTCFQETFKMPAWTELREGTLALTALQTLGLQECKVLTALPEFLWALTALQTLDLAFCGQLTGLPEGLSALTALKTLDLTRCEKLRGLPAGLSALTALQSLKLYRCRGLTGLPEELSALTALQTLDLFGCSGLTDLPEGLSALTALQTLNLEGCEGLTGLPEGLSALTALQMLDLYGCSGVTALSEGLSALTALQTLDLTGCSKLQELPLWLADLTALEVLDLEDCPVLHTPPPHVVGAGLASVQQFLRDLRKGSAPCHLVKVVLLGDQRAGKSSLADSLKTGKPALREMNDRTVGIDVVRWRLDTDSEVVSHIYDAAGQRVYRATHPLFMSREALFLHVVRSVNDDGTIVSEGQAAGVAAAVLEWVEAVQQEAPGAVMGVVWTHDDALDSLDASVRRRHGDLRRTVLKRVDEAMERGALDVHEAMGAAEADMEDDAVWLEKKNLRDAALDALDKVDMEREVNRENEPDNGTQLRGPAETALQTLPQGLSALTALQTLGLQECKDLAALPEFLWALTALQTLDLTLCERLRGLPEGLSALTALKTLDLTRCEGLRGLPEGLSALTALQSLKLYRCKGLRGLPEGLSALTALQTLDLFGCSGLTDLPEGLSALTALHTLNLEGCKGLTGLPEGLSALTALQMLDLYGCSGVTALPEGLSALTALQTLDLTGCSKLQELPPWLADLTALKVLDLEDCPALPKEQLESGCESLPNANVSLNLKFKAQDGCFEHFKITKTTALKKLMEEYCALQRLEMSTTCFLFDGKRVCETQTPAELNMQDDDVIDARDDETCWMCKGSTLKRLQELTAQVTSLHHQMQELEEQRSRQGTEKQSLEGSRLERLRRQRVLRPRILLSYAVSSKTGHGLEQLRRALSVLMRNQVLFPHVGMKVPLNYAMIERLAQEGRGLAQEGRGRVDAEAKPERAVWESAVTKHVESKASDALRRLCARPHVTLAELETAAGQVGMDRKELESALTYLHATGSALYYGKENRFKHCLNLKETVFLQPQFIINAIKYVIRERKAEDVNDELREMDKRIRNQKDLKDLFTRGVLTGYLLKDLWTSDKCSFTPQDRKLLLEVMKGFKLLRLLGPPSYDAMRERYVVPAMLPNHELPDTYVTPEWWRPKKADGAADFADAQSKATGLGASMRVMYEVVGGRLPFSFMSKLQVSLALKPSNGVKHYASEAAIVDRVAGSVMSDTYTCGGGDVTEWVVISQRTKSCHFGAVDGTPEDPESDSIRVVAWAELINDSQHGATDWRLFKRVMHEVECEERESPGLYLMKLALYVGADGQCAEPEKVEDVRHSEFVTFKFRCEQSSERSEEVKRNRVLPQENVETTLVNRQPVDVHPSKVHQIDAFFAKETGDRDLLLNEEGQLLVRIVVNPGNGWNCTTNPQPTIDDLYRSIKHAKQRNLCVLHLAGHASQECGFFWNANDAATASRTFDVDAISIAIGSVAGENGPLECVVLNACCTEKMGRSLREKGVPNVLCWQTEVLDETAREMCGCFFRPLVEEKEAGKRNYKRAFFAAIDAMRSSEDRVSTAQQEEHSGSSRRRSESGIDYVYRRAAWLSSSLAEHHGLGKPGGKTCSSLEDAVSILALEAQEEELSGSRASSRRGSAQLQDCVSTAQQDEHSGSTASSRRGSQRAIIPVVPPWKCKDVVLFLSDDGDSEPIYLWRESPVLLEPALAPAGQTLAADEDVDKDSAGSVCPAGSSAAPRAHLPVASAARAPAGHSLAAHDDVDEDDSPSDGEFVC